MFLRPSSIMSQPYLADAVVFDGLTTWLTRGAALTGAVNGKEGTVSFWAKMDVDGISSRLLINTGGRFNIRQNANNTIRVVGDNTSGVNVIRQDSLTGYNIAGGWMHFLSSWNLATLTVKIYTNDVDDTSAPDIAVDDLIHYDRADWAVGAAIAGTTPLAGALSDLWFNTTYMDLTVEANRRKFITASKRPVYLGANGELPTGSSPLLFMSGPTADWHTNKGTGGGFTENGTLTDSPTNPSS